MARALDLRVVGIEMRAKAEVLDQIDQVGGVQNEHYRVQNRALGQTTRQQMAMTATNRAGRARCVKSGVTGTSKGPCLRSRRIREVDQAGYRG
jgi:hypothetical protein